MNLRLVAVLGIFAHVAVLVSRAEELPKIHVNPGRYGDYYHIEFTLTPDNMLLTVPVSERMPKYGGSNEWVFAEGGQFEVFIPKDKFPIAAPRCRKYIILRMPYTSLDQPKAQAFMAEKKALFDQIERLKRTGVGAVEVAIEVSNYATVVNQNPLKLELTACNVFFRQAYGRYINHTGPLPDKDR